MRPAPYFAAAAALAPLLWAQGRHVRRVTPRLPEPPGERSGCAGSAHLPLLRVLIAGDSAAAGVGAAHQRDALSGQLALALAPHHQVQWQLLARTGDTTQHTLEHLRQHPAQPFDVAVLSLGVNDVTGGVRIAPWQRQLHTLADVLADRFGVQRIVFAAVPPMGRFTALPQPLRWFLGERAQQLNAAMRQVVAKRPHTHWAPLPDMAGPDSHFLASDGFHPGPAAYPLWARGLARIIVG